MGNSLDMSPETISGHSRVDLHVHTLYSDRPSEWVLRRIGAPESFTEPKEIYRACIEAGMDFVTISDHNRIEGALEIAHLPRTFISSEVTTYFPEDGCKIHCLVSGISEDQFRDIQRVRSSIYEFRDYLYDHRIIHSVAHPLFSVNGRLTIAHLEKLLVLFKRFEVINGARDPRAGTLFRVVAQNLSPREIEVLADRHGLDPRDREPWRKYFTAGSDDHSGLYIASAFTQTPKATSTESLLQHLLDGEHEPAGAHGSSLQLARNFYSIAYRFYRERLLGKSGKPDDLFAVMLERLLKGESSSQLTRSEKLKLAARRFVRPGRKTMGEIDRALVSELVEWVAERDGEANVSAEQRCFQTAKRLSHQLSFAGMRKAAKNLKKGKLTESLQSMASLGPVAFFIAPYLAAFQSQHKDERLHRQVAGRFPATRLLTMRSPRRAWFTDTFNQANSIAMTIDACAKIAVQEGRNLQIVTSSDSEAADRPQLRNFPPVGRFKLPEGEHQLSFPPFLDIFEFCEREEFCEVIISTPGPVGLAGIAAAKLMNTPVTGIFHTDFPLYVRYLTGSEGMEDLTWRYLHHVYDQMDRVYVPSRLYLDMLQEKGFDPSRLRLLPRGIDRALFNPSKRSPTFWERFGVGSGYKFLYSGRITREKNLDELLRGFIGFVESGRKADLIVVGDGPYLQELQSRYRRPDVVFTGLLDADELPGAYASADTLLHPGTGDTLDNTILEAQASGLPAVVHRGSVAAEGISDEVTGRIVDMSVPADIQRAMISLFDDEELRTRMAGAAVLSSESGSWSALLDEIWREPESEGHTEPGSENRAAAGGQFLEVSTSLPGELTNGSLGSAP